MSSLPLERARLSVVLHEREIRQNSRFFYRQLELEINEPCQISSLDRPTSSERGDSTRINPYWTVEQSLIYICVRAQ